MKAARGFPFRSDKDAHFVFAGQPFIRGLLPDRRADAADGLIPDFGIEELQFPIAVPERGPLHAQLDVVVCEEHIHLFDGIAKRGGRNHGAAVIDLRGKLDAFDLDAGVGRDQPLEQRLHHQRDGWFERYCGSGRSDRRRCDDKTGGGLCGRIERGKRFGDGGGGLR